MAAFGAILASPVFAVDPMQDVAAILAGSTGAKVRPWSTRDFGRERFSGAISVLLPEEKVEAALWKLRRQLPAGFVAFIGTQNSLADPAVKGTELVVAPAKTQFDILRVAASDAVNYGMGTADLVRKLQEWDRAYGIDIFTAQTDLIRLKLRTMPKNLAAFASEVYGFCPDIVDQGIGSVEELAKAIRNSHEIYLWWD